MKKMLVFVVLVVMFIAMFPIADAADVQKYVVKVDTRLNVRSGPGKKYDVFAKLRNGTKVDVAGYENGWAIILHDFGFGYAETIGYVDPDYLVKYKGSSTSQGGNVSTKNTTKYIVKKSMTGWLNVRNSMSTTSRRLGMLYPGDTVYVANKGSTWSKIVYNGRYAYVMTKYITKSVAVTLPEEGELYEVNITPGTKLNVRTGMSKKKPILERLEDGARVKVIANYGEWSKVYYNGKRTGYVMNEFIIPVY